MGRPSEKRGLEGGRNANECGESRWLVPCGGKIFWAVVV